ncbi:hypothetical protein GCM10028895_18180 [Pontibacter rugosus]
MKILSVRFQNLNSLKGEHEIRFDQSPLAEAGLFAITGPTGAGKTTILDAITVGLYGLVHRHSNDKPLELMTRHTAESYAEVEFEANAKRYRSKWHIRRSRGKVDGNIQPVHMELFSFEENALFDLKPSQVPDKVAELCGLDYGQFLRSVMLSQGDFARFLKANPNERSSLLEKITDTGIYSQISQFAFEKAKAERQKREELERRLQDTHLLPEEQRQAYEQSILELANQESILQKDIAALQEKLQWLQTIAHLQAKQVQHQAALQVQEQKLESLKPDFQKLQQHEQAHKFVGELAEIRSANGKVTEMQEQLQTLEKRLPILETEMALAGNLATEASKAHHQQEEKLHKLEPLLLQVGKLDHQLSSLREGYSKSKAAYVSFDEVLKQDQQLLQTKQLELDKLTKEATSIKTWLKQQAGLQELRTALPDFKATLRELQEVGLRLQRLQQEQLDLQQQRQQEALQLAAIEQNQAQQQAQHAQLQKQKQEQIAQLQAILADKSLEELEQTAQAQPAMVAKYERLLELAVQHNAQQQKLQSINLHLSQNEQQTKDQTQELQALQTKHKLAAEHLEALQKLVQLQQQIQQYEEARHTLIKDEPCPLCGATHHPFIEDNYKSDLPEEVQKRDKQQALVRELEQSMNQCQLLLGALQQQQKLAATTKAELEAEVERLIHGFGQLSETLLLRIPVIETQKLAELLETHQNKTDVLQQQLAKVRALSREVESINLSLQKLREEQMQAQGKHNQLQASDKLLQNQQKLQLRLADEQQQQQDHAEIAQSFAATFGQEYKQDSQQQLLQTLEQLAATYAQKQQALEDMREQYAALREQVKSLSERVQEKTSEQQERQQALKNEHEKLTRLKTERQALFGDKDPEQERKQAQHELKAKANQAEEARAHHLKKQQELQELRARRTECHSKHQQHKLLHDELQNGLLRVLQQKGIETIDALSQMLLKQDEADRLANLKAQTEKHLTETRKSFSDVKQEMAQTQELALTSEGKEGLALQLQEKNQLQRELISQRARQEQLLEQDTRQRERNKELAVQLQIQQQLYHRWSQLSDLIGSSDGNKFSRFAQGLTLARLVELANRHLLKLNDRYRILKSTEEDLELLIIDTYQAEAIRPMNTLSGGESFW